MRFLFRLFVLLVFVVGLAWVFRVPILNRLDVFAGRHTENISELDFSVDSIAQELRATGRVVRRKVATAGRELEESTRDARTTAKLKARFALDPELKAREIDIDTQDGRVTLRGRVDNHEQVARAIRMAVEEDDVLEVTSILQVHAAPEPTRRAESNPAP